MDETELLETTRNNLLFSALGGVCALIVGLAIFGNSVKTSPGRSPSSESGWTESTSLLPVLD